MKTFYIAIVLFVLMIAAIVINALYINRVCDRMYFMASEAPGTVEEGCCAEVSILEEFWLENQKYIRLSVSFIEINQISNSISSMKAFAESGDEGEFENARRILLNTIQEMRRLESLRWSSMS